MDERFDRYLVAGQILNLMNRLSYRSRLVVTYVADGRAYRGLERK